MKANAAMSDAQKWLNGLDEESLQWAAQPAADAEDASVSTFFDEVMSSFAPGPADDDLTYADGFRDAGRVADTVHANFLRRLLSDECVEVGAKALAFVGLEAQFADSNDAVWKAAAEAGREMFRREYRAAVTAALAQIGGAQ